jgi:hypothetical protein
MRVAVATRRPLTPSPAPNQSSAAVQGPALSALLVHATTAVLQLRSYYRKIIPLYGWHSLILDCFFFLRVLPSPGCF